MSRESLKKEFQGSEFDEVMNLLSGESLEEKDFIKALAFLNNRKKENPQNELFFSIPGNPAGWNRAVKTATHVYDPNVGTKSFVIKCFKDTVGESFIPIKGEVTIQITAYKQIPKSVPKYKRILMELGEIKPTTKPDYDNIGGNIGDALNGVLYYDDAQVSIGLVEKRFSIKPRVEVFVMYRCKDDS